MTKRLLTLPQVLRRVPYSKTEWYRGMKEGRYPKSYPRQPDRPESRGVCWRSQDIDELIRWIESGGSFTPSFSTRGNPPTTASSGGVRRDTQRDCKPL